MTRSFLEVSPNLTVSALSMSNHSMKGVQAPENTVQSPHDDAGPHQQGHVGPSAVDVVSLRSRASSIVSTGTKTSIGTLALPQNVSALTGHASTAATAAATGGIDLAVGQRYFRMTARPGSILSISSVDPSLPSYSEAAASSTSTLGAESTSETSDHVTALRRPPPEATTPSPPSLLTPSAVAVSAPATFEATNRSDDDRLSDDDDASTPARVAAQAAADAAAAAAEIADAPTLPPSPSFTQSVQYQQQPSPQPVSTQPRRVFPAPLSLLSRATRGRSQTNPSQNHQQQPPALAPVAVSSPQDASYTNAGDSAANALASDDPASATVATARGSPPIPPSPPLSPLTSSTNALSAHYTRIVRTIDANHRAELQALRSKHTRDLAATRHSIDAAYRAEFRSVRARAEASAAHLHAELGELQHGRDRAEEAEAAAVQRARNEVEDVWEGRWRDRMRLAAEEIAEAWRVGKAWEEVVATRWPEAVVDSVREDVRKKLAATATAAAAAAAATATPAPGGGPDSGPNLSAGARWSSGSASGGGVDDREKDKERYGREKSGRKAATRTRRSSTGASASTSGDRASVAGAGAGAVNISQD